jgi:hypothetical protein
MMSRTLVLALGICIGAVGVVWIVECRAGPGATPVSRLDKFVEQGDWDAVLRQLRALVRDDFDGAHRAIVGDRVGKALVAWRGSSLAESMLWGQLVRLDLLGLSTSRWWSRNIDWPSLNSVARAHAMRALASRLEQGSVMKEWRGVLASLWSSVDSDVRSEVAAALDVALASRLSFGGERFVEEAVDHSNELVRVSVLASACRIEWLPDELSRAAKMDPAIGMWNYLHDRPVSAEELANLRFIATTSGWPEGLFEQLKNCRNMGHADLERVLVDNGGFFEIELMAWHEGDGNRATLVGILSFLHEALAKGVENSRTAGWLRVLREHLKSLEMTWGIRLL